MMSWLFQSKVAKSHFYVWYLGSKEADGVRGSAVVLPVMRQLLRESFKKTPSKATVQISAKGLKLVQSVPTMSRSGKVKMQMVKFHIAANCITYSITGKAPFDDVVGVVMLVLNPEMQSPMHVHCYRCDCAETAQILHANIQVLLSRPEVQRSIMDLEHRLFLSGLLLPRTRNRAQSSSRTSSSQLEREGRQRPEEIPPLERMARQREKKLLEERVDTQREERKQKMRGDQRMPRKVVDELKNKMVLADHLRSHESLSDFLPHHGSNGDLRVAPPTRLRLFGDTIKRDTKSRSLDNLNTPMVSINTRGRDVVSPPVFPRSELIDPFAFLQPPLLPRLHQPTRMTTERMAVVLFSSNFGGLFPECLTDARVARTWL